MTDSYCEGETRLTSHLDGYLEEDMTTNELLLSQIEEVMPLTSSVSG